ncbi:hypothetical protein N0V83_001837 [Neocucurbitaria cava]|uniref:chitinase n=1 Tax=Neocucurbitaria cava TaxID=798079 RepID=A0A9W8YDI8_9PLEO|nr:hypothetical protein N0V83_001837 [Neocucurbitaria cava]
MRLPSVALLTPALLAASASARFLMYADEWHPTRPANPDDRAGIDHVVLAFAMANATASFQPTVPISTIRSEYPNANVSIAVGGWGDDIGFFDISQTDASIQQFAADIATMLTNTGADGVDIDWEYPGGNGADYKQVPNSQKVYQIDAYPKVLQAIRAAIGDKLLTIAVPGEKIDMIAFTKDNGPKIWPSVDYINVMAYDLMNRRDNITNHHSSVAGSEDTIKNYLAIGAPPEKINRMSPFFPSTCPSSLFITVGFAYYAKYFTTQGDCSSKPLGCPIVLAEDPVTGKDTGTSGAWTFETSHMEPVNATSITVSYDGTCGPDKNTKCANSCCSVASYCGTGPDFCSGGCQHAFGTGCTDADVASSWQNAAQNGVTDEEAGGQYYYDPQNNLFWTWDTPELISRKFDQIVRKYNLGGVMAWSLGEDSYDWSHIRAMATELAKDGSSTQVAEDSGATSTPQDSDATLAAQDYAATPAAQDYATPAAQESDAPVAAQDYEAIPVDPSLAAEATPANAEAPSTEDTSSDATSPQAEEAPVAQDAFSPTEDSSASFSSDAPDRHPSLESDPNLPYDVVWVDGTDDGPDGDYSEDPGSPSDYSVNYPSDDNADPSAESDDPSSVAPTAPADAEETGQPSTESIESDQPFTPNTEVVQPADDSSDYSAQSTEDPDQSPDDSTTQATTTDAAAQPADSSTTTTTEDDYADGVWTRPADPADDSSQDAADATWAQPVDDDASVGASSRQGQYDAADAAGANADLGTSNGASCRVRRRRRARKA